MDRNITLYRNVVINRLIWSLDDYGILDGKAVKHKNSEFRLWTTNPNNDDVKKFIENIHKFTAHTDEKEPIELKDGGLFLGLSKSDYVRPKDTVNPETHVNPMFDHTEKITGIVTLGFQKNGTVFFVPTFGLYFNESPHLLVNDRFFKVGTQLESIDKEDEENTLLVNLKDEFLNEICEFSYHRLSDIDKAMTKILLSVDTGNKNYVKNDISMSTKLAQLGIKSGLSYIVDKMLLSPVVKLDPNGDITDILVQKGTNMALVNFKDFSKEKMFAVVLVSDRVKGDIHDILDTYVYDFAGRNFYVDDTEWVDNEKGGYDTKYRVVEEDKVYAESSVKGVIFSLKEKIAVSENNDIIEKRIEKQLIKIEKYIDYRKKMEEIPPMTTEFRNAIDAIKISKKSKKHFSKLINLAIKYKKISKLDIAINVLKKYFEDCIKSIEKEINGYKKAGDIKSIKILQKHKDDLQKYITRLGGKINDVY